jgi:hypothetical protein
MPRITTIKDIQNSACASLNPHLFKAKAPKKSNGPKPKDKTKAWMQLMLKAYAEANQLLFLAEYQFDEERRWRFDWALMKDGQPLVAIEYEGGVFQKKSGHTTGVGYSENTIKYNAAANAGWQLLRYTITTYKNLSSDLANLKL